MSAAVRAGRAGPLGSAAGARGALPLVYLNGRRVAAGGRHLSALDRGVTLADGLFETMRVYEGRVFRLDSHLARLAAGAAALEIGPLPDVRAHVLRAVAAAGRLGDANAGVRLTVTRGAAGAGVAPPPAAAPPTVLTVVSPLPDFPPRIYESGVHAHVATGRRNQRAATAGLKTLAYTDAVAALIEARRAGAEEVIFLDTDGHCAEAASSNLFVWTGDVLLTPPPSCGALPGITRAAVIELARDLGVPVEERPFEVGELLAGREAFLTSSLREIAPLVRVGDRPLGAGVPGEVTRRTRDAYDALVTRERGP